LAASSLIIFGIFPYTYKLLPNKALSCGNKDKIVGIVGRIYAK
jgi:hypothetical protein